MVITMTAGTGLIMWIGELVTERGVGNGMSLLIFTSIAARFPDSLGAIATEQGLEVLVVVIAIGILIIGLVVFVEQSQRRIPVQYAKRMVGRRTYGGNNTYIPIKVNMAGVVPGHLRVVAAVPARADRAVQPARGRQSRPRRGCSGSTNYLTTRRPPAVHGAVLPAHRRLHATSTSRSPSTRMRSPTT